MITKPRNYSWRKLCPDPWPAIWLWVFLVNIILGFITPESFTLMFIRIGGIVLCLIYTIYLFPKDRLLQLAMLVTVSADIILAVNNVAEAGVIVFIIAQVIHFSRLKSTHSAPIILIFSLFSLAIIILNYIFRFITPMYVLSFFYVVAIITNLILSLLWHHSNPDNPRALFAIIGFTLFLCCDIFTGISYLSFTEQIPTFFYVPANFFAWFFYYPSQICISNSSKLKPQA